MTPRQRLDELATTHELEILVADGFDDALIGTIELFCHQDRCAKTHAVYDTQKCIQLLMDKDGMEETEAWEFFEFNVIGAVIKGGPVFMQSLLPDVQTQQATT